MKGIASWMVLAAAVLWGASGIFVNLLTALGMTGLQITAVRLCAVPVLVALVLARDRRKFRIEKRDLGYFALGGVLGVFAFSLCYTYAIQRTGMATAAVLIYLMPSLVMLFSVVFLHERFTAVKALCLALSLAGCALVSGIADGFTVEWGGVGMGLLAAVFYTLYNLLASTRLKKYGSFTIIFYVFLFAGAASLAYTALQGGLPALAGYCAGHPQAVLLCLLLSVCCSFLTYWLYNTAVKTIPASRAAVIATFEPVAAALFGFFLFREQLTGCAVLGIGCEFAALVLLNLPEKTSKL